MEDIVIEPCESGGTSTKHVTSLGISKATHEFLTLHYFALDSAEWWEQILGELLPNAQFPAAVIRRTIAYQMFMAAHIAPSHRRPPHPVWEDSLSLIADLLFGNGVDRYVGAMQRADSPLEVNVREFSAGSYSGLAFLHILWSIPRVTTKGCLGAIACPPALLSMSRAKREDRLHLIHYENDSLCSWKPGLQQIQGCCTSFTYITNEITSYKGHFGPDDHDYSHWMALELPHGCYALRVLLFIRPAAASKARRDATPLRLISWLSYKLNPELEQFIEMAMEHLSTWTETEGGKVLTMGKEAIPRGGTVNSEEELRNELIDLISVGNLKHKPQALFTLFRQFLTRISLPRLIHFMDLVLPQLTPVQAAWAGEEKTLWSCHYIRWLRERHSDATPRVQISYFFSSHDNIHHVRIQWNNNPLLLFTDPTMVEALPVEHFSQQASHMTHQQHLQMGLRKGMAILIYYVIGDTHYQAVLLAEESVMNRGRRGENRLWKRVTPTVTEFAWLPPNLAESFCKNALYRDDVRTYCAFDTPHLGLDTKNFVADVFVENILYLGDTRGADDFSVFTKMAPERLCLGCGLRVDEPFAPISTGERKKLFYAAQKLLTFVLHEVSAQTLSEEETALKIALRPLIINKDGHFVAAVISMYQSLLEGKTDCPSGVFGAGKTLSAAAMIAGLLVMDPSLTIMIVTKENVAAHAFVKHFLRLGLPESINCLVGRLVGYVEMKKGPANQTALDIPPAFRNDVLRSKRVLVGCGGGFHQECQQPYSPVASWMEDADVALNDEGQQYGNLDEASAIARVPRKCLVIWCGDHKQTPGGLRKTDEAKAFRRKLLRRPIALRGDTKHFQPNMLGKVVLRYLDGMDEPLINRVQVILRATMGGRSVASAEDIVTLLRRSLKTARGAYPPVALAEIYQEFKSPLTMIRRLHLMVVDLDRSRSVSPQVYQDFMNCRVSLDPAGSLNTLPVPISGKDCPFQTRYVFAYGMDNSDRPSYLLWPIRGGNGQFLLVDPWSGNYFDLEAAKFVKPIGIEHFFDAFSLEKKRPLKVDAASALNIPVKEVSDSLVVSQDKAKRFELTPVWAPAEPPTKRAKTAEVRLSSASNVLMPPTNDENEKGSSDEEDSDSSGSNSDVSSQDDSSDVSDLEKFDEAYTDFGALTKGVDPRTLERDGSANPNEDVPGIDLPGGMKALHPLANVPKSWPLARLTIPLSAASKHLERLLEGCCNEIYVRNTNPDLQLHFVRKFAKDLVVVLAFHLAETIAALFRHVLHHLLHHPSKVLYDPETEPLFLPLFWFYPIYREMLNSASRHRPSKSMELRRAASGLVKVICRTEESRPNGRGKKPGKPKQKGLLASFEEWFGSINMMNILYVWFPASWGPSVVEAIQTRNVTCLAKKPIVRDPHIFDRKEAARGSRAREVTCRIQKWNIKAEGFHPILVANARVDWLAMNDDDITKKFPILLEGILQDVYSQRAASAWQGAQPQKLTVSMLLPGTSSAAEWRDLLQSRSPILAYTNHSACLSCPGEC